MSESVRCPNCGQKVASEPIRCLICGYRSESAGEFLWLYVTGALVMLVGLVMGALGVSANPAPVDHWSRALRGWFPLGPWPVSEHWLAFLVSGMLLTVCGMGLTRRKSMSWFVLVVLLAWEAVWTARKLVTDEPRVGSPLLAAMILFAEVALLLLTLRAGLALCRTPKRDGVAMQRAARETQQARADSDPRSGGSTDGTESSTAGP